MRATLCHLEQIILALFKAKLAKSHCIVYMHAYLYEHVYVEVARKLRALPFYPIWFFELELVLSSILAG